MDGGSTIVWDASLVHHIFSIETLQYKHKNGSRDLGDQGGHDLVKYVF